jgi:hypothetical protein
MELSHKNLQESSSALVSVGRGVGKIAKSWLQIVVLKANFGGNENIDF